MRNDNKDFVAYIDYIENKRKQENFLIKHNAVSYDKIGKFFLVTLGEGADVIPKLDASKKKVFFIGGSGSSAVYLIGREDRNGNKSYKFDELKYDYVMAFEPITWPYKDKGKCTFTVPAGRKKIIDGKEEYVSIYEKLIGSIITDGESKGIYRSEELIQAGDAYYFLLIRATKGDGVTFDPTYLDAYFDASDSRTYKDNAYVVYNEREYIAVNRGKIEIPEIDYPRNWLLAGAPVTGKSHTLENALDEYVTNIKDHSKIGYMNYQERKDSYKEEISCRVTFYEEYSYENFAGCYKPIMKHVSNDANNRNTQTASNTGNDTVDERISYEFEPGPFIDIYVKAWKALLVFQAENSEVVDSTMAPERFFLIIEEINRAKAASVFGELFQLLDRNKDGYSKYTVVPEKSLCKYLEEQGLPTTMQLPPNMYIWATMNSADQGVYPLDAAFKRRWSYKYMDIFKPRDPDPGIVLNTDEGPQVFLWEKFRYIINSIILNEGMDEDKCIGPYYFNDREFAEIAFYTCAGNPDEKVLKKYFSEFNNNSSGSMSVPDGTIEKVIKNKNYRKEHDSPLMAKLFFYLYQDLFKYEPEKMFNPEIVVPMSISQIMNMMEKSESIYNILNVREIEPADSADAASELDSGQNDSADATPESDSEQDSAGNE